MDFAIAQLALIFLPGVLWANIDKKFGAGLRPNETILFLRAFVFGITTYAVLFLLYEVAGAEFGYNELGNSADDVNIFDLRDEIALSVPLSFILSMGWLYAVKNRWLMKTIHWLGVSNRFGDEDVWSYTFNSDDAYVEYVHVRDIDQGFVFAGWVNSYSENEEERELLLREVIVYRDDGSKVVETPFIYLSRPKSNIWIEFPFRKDGYTDVKEN